ncbi:MAG TPA: class I SAM-dependent methyltransferase, partial [Actinomycetota bacterium]|nr:class I SAM-dependent methyltransferase [Actinomycetota bacterium]
AGQDPRWRRFLVSRVRAIPGSWVLDVASGTGLVARELARKNLRVVGLDQSPAMVRRAAAAVRARGLEERVKLALGQAQALPFADEAFDAVTFTYLLRYVDDPGATLRELARVLRPGGVLAALEFHVPQDPWVHAGWYAYTRGIMPLVGGAVTNAWYRTGRFLGPNISEFYRRYPLAEQVRLWQEAGIRRVRSRKLSLGVAVVIWGVKENVLVDA